MCNAIRDGGQRCAVHQHTSTAAIRTVAAHTGLEVRQVESVFRELRREGGRNAVEVPQSTLDAMQTELRTLAEALPVRALYERQMASAAETNEEQTPQTHYALQRLLTRSTERAANLQGALADIANRTGYTAEELRHRYQTEYAAVPTGNGVEMPEEMTPANQTRARRAGLPYDRASVVAFERTRELAERNHVHDEVNRRITSWETPRSETSNIITMGYDEGRLEVHLVNNPEQVYAYQNVPEDLWNRLRESPRPGTIHLRSISGNEEFQYASVEEANRDAYRVRCASCGQFRAAVHSCPERERRERLVRAGYTTEEIVEALANGTDVEENTTSDSAHELFSRIPQVDSADESTVREFVASEHFQERMPFGQAVQTENGRWVVDLVDHSNEGSSNPFGENRYFDSRHSSINNRGTSRWTHDFADRENPTPDELMDISQYNAAYSDLNGVRTLHYVNVVRDNLHNMDFRMPVQGTFSGSTSPDSGRFLQSGTVTGSLTLGRLDEGERLEDVVTRERDLRCDCADYQENYDCVHVRTVTRNPYVFLVNRSNQFIEGEHLRNYRSRFSSQIIEEQSIRRYMNDNGMTREAAVALIEEERAEERRAAEERENYYQASLAERRRMDVERGVRNAARLATSNAGVIAENDAHRARMAARWEEVEPGYSDNVDGLYEDYVATMRRRRAGEEVLDYRIENVTDGICSPEAGGRAFGIELEFDIDPGVNRYQALQTIARELHEAGLTEQSYQTHYHSARASGWGSWSFEEDSTVSGELVSPIMRDTPENWQQIQTALEIIKRNGGIATTRTGSHVHISTASYESSPAKHMELIRQVNANEEMMYRLASNPERGSHRGMQWCGPNVNTGTDDIAADVSSAHNVMRDHVGHGYAMNFESTYQQDYRRSNVEFRMWDGTLDAAVIQRQIMVSAAMTDYAERNVIANGRTSNVPRQTVGGEREVQRQIHTGRGRLSRDHFEQTMGNAPQFMDNLFRRQEDRRRIAELFSITNWADYSNNYEEDYDY
jgi:hypothetical protein